MNDYLLIAENSAIQLLLPVVFSCLFSLILGYATARIAIGKRHTVRIIYLCCMFALYGVVLGFLIGISEKSIARDAFSGVVTILSGYFGYILSKDLHPRLKAMIPAAVICFLISLLVSITYFSKVRGSFGCTRNDKSNSLSINPTGQQVIPNEKPILLSRYNQACVQEAWFQRHVPFRAQIGIGSSTTVTGISHTTGRT